MTATRLKRAFYAEDPDKGFRPFRPALPAPPQENAHVRVDTGVEQGDVITPYYDPMIAKLIVWDETRDLALARMRPQQYRVVGVQNNLSFLTRLLELPGFRESGAGHRAGSSVKAPLFPAQTAVPGRRVAARGAGRIAAREPSRFRDCGRSRLLAMERLDGWRLNGTGKRRVALKHGDEQQSVSIVHANGAWELSSLGDEPTSRALWWHVAHCVRMARFMPSLASVA